MGERSPADARVRPDLGLPERYEPLRRIATGGMASVWCARDRALGRNVAIKLLAEQFAYDEDASERFMREARAAARLSGHPHVVMTYDVGETEPVDGKPPRAFIVMEYLAGGTVADAVRVDSVRRVNAVKWVHEAASALDYAHGRGVLHRDIKPANLLLNRDRVLHVGDFGIARLGTEDTITATGQVIGTASYLAPERALGRPATDASDRYSLAVAAYELLVGERPFTATNFAIQARQHVEDEPPAASSRNRALPPAVDAVLDRGMAKQPEQRWPTAQEFARALEAALSEPATKPLRTAVAGVTARRGARRTAPPAAAVPAAEGRAQEGRARRIAPEAEAVAPTAGRGARRMAPAAAAAADAPATAGRGSRTTASRASTPPPAPDGRRHRRHRARVPAIAALAAGAAVAVVAAGTIGGGGSSPGRSSASGQRSASGERSAAATPTHRAAPAHTRPASAPRTTHSVTATPAAATTPPPVGATLEARGHQLMLNGNYGGAVPVLRQAVAAAPQGSLTYAYALYDLGRSLRLAGDPAAAVKVLYQRLQIPNQTETVRQQLQLALQALGQQARQSGGAAGQAGSAGPQAPAGGAPAVPGAAGDRGSRGHHVRGGGAGPAGQGVPQGVALPGLPSSHGPPQGG